MELASAVARVRAVADSAIQSSGSYRSGVLVCTRRGSAVTVRETAGLSAEAQPIDADAGLAQLVRSRSQLGVRAHFRFDRIANEEAARTPCAMVSAPSIQVEGWAGLLARAARNGCVVDFVARLCVDTVGRVREPAAVGTGASARRRGFAALLLWSWAVVGLEAAFAGDRSPTSGGWSKRSTSGDSERRRGDVTTAFV